MTRLFLTLVAACLMITAVPSFSVAQTETDGIRPGAAEPAATSPTLKAPVFKLETLPDDSPEMAVKKAALRLFNGYNLTVNRLMTCKAADPEAGKALGTYNSRNGNTVGLVMRVIKRLGGISPEVKDIMDQDIDRRLSSESVNCQSLVKSVNDGQKDIYKAQEFISDYKLVQSMK